MILLNVQLAKLVIYTTESENVKFLGVIIDDELNWEAHIKHPETKLKAAKELNSLFQKLSLLFGKVCNYDHSEFYETCAHIHKVGKPNRYLGGNLGRMRKFLASERKFLG